MAEGAMGEHKRITIFTIGFAKKSARQFFDLLQQAGVRKLMDVRLNNVSQLAGFTKKNDLEYFLGEIAGIEYRHLPELAPTKEILDAYKKKVLSWDEYEKQFFGIVADRQIDKLVTPDELHRACLLCSEPKADKCHRRLLAEYLLSKWGDVEIIHL